MTLRRQVRDVRGVGSLLGGLMLAAALVPSTALANRADLDLSFGIDGVVALPLLDSSSFLDVAVQADGRIVAVGYASQGGVRQWAVVRFNTDGSLDNSFGSNGVSLLPAPVSVVERSARAVALDAAGNILVGGADKVMRLTPAGALDTGYGVGGIYTLPLTPDQTGFRITDIVHSADGGFLVSGSFSMVWAPMPIYASQNIAVVKLTSAGVGNAGFGTNGLAYVSATTNRLFAEAMSVVEAAGAIFVPAWQQSRTQSITSSVAYKLLADGSTDGSFGALEGGMPLFATSTFGSSYASSIALQSGGALVVGGLRYGLDAKLVVSRITTGGQVSPGFTEFLFPGAPAPGADWLRVTPQVLVGADDRIVAAGWNGANPVLAGLLSNGTPDPDFGTSGIAPVPFDGVGARQLAQQPDGKYLIVGGGEAGDSAGIMYIARLRGSALIPPELSVAPAAGDTIAVSGGLPSTSQLLGSIVFSNRGGDPLSVTGCAASTGFSVSGNFPLTIASGASQSLAVSCIMPATPFTTRTGTLTCSGINDADEPEVSYNLSCTSGAALIPASVPATGRGTLTLLALALAALGLLAFSRRMPRPLSRRIR